jgi:hypothetical protein
LELANNIQIKDIERLEDLLRKDLAWRKKEILSLRILVEKDQVNEPILLRSGIALLSAHFEGFIRRASNCYIAYVSGQKIKYEELKSNFIALKMEKEFKRCSKSEKNSVHTDLLESYQKLSIKRFDEKYFEDNGFISTHSNPGTERLKEILATIGIESDIFEMKANYIDSSLLANRNKIVHGEYSDLDRDDFFNTFEIIIKIIEQYEQLIIQAAEERQYLKVKEVNK